MLVVNTLCVLDIMKAAQLSDSRHILHAVHNVDFETVFSYNLGQNLLRHITKIPIFFTHPDKNAYRRKLKDRFPPPLLQCCLR